MIPEPAWLYALIYLITDESKHFLLAVSMGLLAFLLMEIIWYAICLVYHRLTHRKVSTAVDFGMFISCLLVGLSFALASHWALDFVSLWYVTPLGPGLDLIMP